MILLVIIAVVALLVALALHRREPPQDKVSYRVLVDLHAIRRCFDLARYKFDVRRDAADARCELHAELRKLDERERQS